MPPGEFTSERRGTAARIYAVLAVFIAAGAAFLLSAPAASAYALIVCLSADFALAIK